MTSWVDVSRTVVVFGDAVIVVVGRSVSVISAEQWIVLVEVLVATRATDDVPLVVKHFTVVCVVAVPAANGKIAGSSKSSVRNALSPIFNRLLIRHRVGLTSSRRFEN